MGWEATGQPPVRKQRDDWVVRVDGIDTVTGHRPRQLGTYGSQRSALAAARSVRAEARPTERETVSWSVRRYVAGRTDISVKSRQQYEWAIPHIEGGFGAIRRNAIAHRCSAVAVRKPVDLVLGPHRRVGIDHGLGDRVVT